MLSHWSNGTDVCRYPREGGTVGLGGWLSMEKRSTPFRRNQWMYKPRIPHLGLAVGLGEPWWHGDRGQHEPTRFALGRTQPRRSPFWLPCESLAHKMEALVCFTGSGYESTPNPPALPATSCSYIPSHNGATHRAELRCLTSTPGVGTWGNGS